jgi:hypothetical protein
LGPEPDAVEYFAGARSLADTGRYRIVIGERELPPRYPFGYPLLIEAVLAALPRAAEITAPFRANQILGLVVLVAVFVWEALAGRWLAAALSAALIVTLPAFITFARSSVSEIASLAIVLGTFAGFSVARQRGALAPALIGSALLGVGLWTRLVNALFAPLILLACPTTGRRPVAWIVATTACLLAFSAAAAPLFVYQWRTLGSPFTTGYHYWVPAIFEGHGSFNLSCVAGNIAVLAREITLRNDVYRVTNIFGTGTYYSPALLVLVVAALLAWLRLPGGWIFAVPVLVSSALSLAYCISNDPRFQLTPVVFGILAAARWGEDILRRRGLLMQTLYICLVVLSCLGYPTQSGFPPAGGRFQIVDLLDRRYLGTGSPVYEAVRSFGQAHGDEAALVLTDANPAYLESLLPAPTSAVPDGPHHAFMYSRIFRFGKGEALADIEAAVEANRSVYHLTTVPVTTTELTERLPPPSGTHWQRQPLKHGVLHRITVGSAPDNPP